MERKIDCRHFRGSRPCVWNKQEGAECPDCAHYDPLAERILVIKLDAIGDVLRSTCILPKLKEYFPGSAVTWITRRASASLLDANEHVDDVWMYEDPEGRARLQVQQWDRVYNLDNSGASSALASIAAAPVKVGFTLSEKGAIMPTNDAAEYWLNLACFDRLKRENTRSYQSIMYAICGFDPPLHRPQLRVPEGDAAWAREFLSELFLPHERRVLIGINTGSGSRWPLKMMSAQRIAALARTLVEADPRWGVVLLGGPEEAAKNELIRKATGAERVANAGCDHSLLRFAALVQQCRALVCGDTLALHVATALNVPTVACFCPTSAHEIHDYEGLIVKVAPHDCDCLCSYNAACPYGRNCIDALPFEPMVRALAAVASRPARLADTP